MPEKVNHMLVQMISSHIGLHHTNWDGILQNFAYAILMAIHELTGKIPAKLFCYRKSPFKG